MTEYNSEESLLAVVADGTNIITGWKDGMISHMERDLQTILLWLICQLHGNEFGLRHVFTHYDGGYGTSGPNSFKGEIGQSLMKEIDKLEIVAFRSIDSPDLPDEVVKDLSRDQHLLYLYTKAIATGPGF